MLEDKKSLEEKKEFNEMFGKLLLEIAETTEVPAIKSMNLCYKLTSKLHDLIDVNKLDNDTYTKNVCNFLEKLNELTDDFIKEYN